MQYDSQQSRQGLPKQEPVKAIAAWSATVSLICDMKRVLIADEMHPSLPGMLEAAGFAYTYLPQASRADMLREIADYEGLIIRSKTRIDEALLEAAPRLRFIGRAGAGLDLIDTAATARRGIRLFAANAGNADAVGEHALGMLLALLNRIVLADAQVRQRRWLREENRGTELMGLTVGLLGYGHNGQAFARRLSGMGVQVLAYDKYRDAYADAYARAASLSEIQQQADVLSLHLPLTPETQGLVGQDFIAAFRKPFYFMNISRGEIAVLADVRAALEAGRLRGACLDVLENEKLDALTPAQAATFDALAARPDVVFTPHIAGWTHESYRRINEVLMAQLAPLA